MEKKSTYYQDFKQLEQYVKMNGFLSARMPDSNEPRYKFWNWGEPEIGPLFHIFDWLRQLGLGTELTWAEVKAWADLTGTNPNPHEAQAIITLSKSWLSEFKRGHEKNALPCWAPEF